MAGTSKTPIKRKLCDENRQFQEAWTNKYFFIENSSKKIMCLICQSCIAIPKEYNLKRHYLTNHKSYESITGELRKQKLHRFLSNAEPLKKLTDATKISNVNAAEVGYEIAHLIAKRSRPFTDGAFVKDCMMIAIKKLCPNQTKTFENLSLSRNTIQRRIADLSDVFGQLKERTNAITYFSLAMDESTDISSSAQLLVFVRAVTDNFTVYEELIGMSSLEGQTKGSDLLKSVLENVNNVGLSLKNLVGVTTDGAPNMIGKNSGLVSLLQKQLENERELIKVHCILHQHNLCCKQLGFSHVMKVVVSTVNFIKSKALNHRQFKSFLEEIEAECKDVIYYTEIRWLSRGKTLERFLSLLDEIILFLNEKDHIVPELEDVKWLSDLSFLVDITHHLNVLNIKLQGKNQMVSDLASHFFAFEQKLTLFKSTILKGELGHFPSYKAMLEKHGAVHQADVYANKIGELQNAFEKRFGDFRKLKKSLQMFGNPFSANPEELEIEAQLELIDLQSCSFLKEIHKEGNLLNFYKCLPKDQYPYLHKKALLYTSLFGSTYICEQTFSLLNLNKSNLRSRLLNENLCSILRLATTSFQPNIKKLADEKQHQASH